MMLKETAGLDSSVDILTANLTSFETITFNCSNAAENTTWSCKDKGAARCSLYPCIRSYRASVNNAKLSETPTGISHEWGSFQQALATIDVDCLTPSERKSLTDVRYTINSTTKWIPYYGPGYYGDMINGSVGPDLSIPNATVPAKCLYQVYEPSQMSLAYFMQTYFNGTISKQSTSSYWYETAGAVQLQKLFNNGNLSFETINQTFTNIADSMTAYIRQSSDSDNINLPEQINTTVPAAGKVYRLETCMRVRWAYLALPLALVVLTLLFFVSMIAQTSRGDPVYDWKSSLLPLLFYGLDTDVKSLHEGEYKVSDMEKTSKQVKVRLVKKRDGWEFAHMG
jgi:hypothetical protein